MSDEATPVEPAGDLLSQNVDPTPVEPTPSEPTPSLGTPEPSLAEPNAPFEFISKDGNLNEGWLDNIAGGELKDNPTLNNFKSLEGMAKTLVNQQSMIKRDHIAKPTDSSPPEEWAAYYNAGGRPESVDGYDITAEAVDANYEYSMDGEKDLLAWAHENGLSNKQANALVARTRNQHIENRNAKDALYNVTQNEAEARLQDQWGSEFANNLKVAQNAMNLSGIKDMIYSLKLENNPTAIQMLYEVGMSMKEDVMGSTDVSAQAASMKEELETLIGEKTQIVASADFHTAEGKARLKAIAQRESKLREALG